MCADAGEKEQASWARTNLLLSSLKHELQRCQNRLFSSESNILCRHRSETVGGGVQDGATRGFAHFDAWTRRSSNTNSPINTAVSVPAAADRFVLATELVRFVAAFASVEQAELVQATSSQAKAHRKKKKRN
jgi:hypothetical protein